MKPASSWLSRDNRHKWKTERFKLYVKNNFLMWGSQEVGKAAQKGCAVSVFTNSQDPTG